MTTALAAVNDGMSFQARLFWKKAVYLFEDNPSIVKVAFESGPKSFDDIWVEYAPGRGHSDLYGRPILREHIQCKWHVNAGDFGYEDLTDPDFINAKTNSHLQKAWAAYQKFGAIPDGTGRFVLLSNWHPRMTDPIKKLVNQRDGGIQLHKLFDSTTQRSEMGKVRKAWSKHLGIDEDKLQELCKSLAFTTDSQTLLYHRNDLDLMLQRHGLRRVPANEDACWFDTLPYQWLAQGRIEFTPQTLRDACTQQNLFEKASNKIYSLGVKSFEHPIDHLEDRCAKVLNLTHSFNERKIRSHEEWAQTLYPNLKSFLLTEAKDHERIQLALDAHLTLSFAAGSILNIKCGRQIELEQRVFRTKIWHAEDDDVDANLAAWNFDYQTPEDEGVESTDLYVSVSLTHDALPDVKKHIQIIGINPSILAAKFVDGTGNAVVKNGRHAAKLAEELTKQINALKRPRQTIHLFISAPAAFAFFLGQLQPSLGRVRLYEYDFGGMNGGGYSQSLELPI